MSNSLKKLQFSRSKKVVNTFTVEWTQVPNGDLLDWVHNSFLTNTTAKTVSLSGNTATYGMTRIETINTQYIAFSLSNVSNVNLSIFSKLISLIATYSKLTKLDVSNNKLLTSLNCNTNNITGTDLDQIYIDLDNNGQSNGTLGIDQGRTSASDTARANLISKGWTITEY